MLKPSERAIYVALHGWSGAGKTWLAHTLPGPRLVLDAENGSWDVEAREDKDIEVLWWDPLTQPVPVDPGDDVSVVANIRDLNVLMVLMKLLRSGEHPFTSVILDSFTEMQAMLKTKVADPGKDYDPNAIFDQQAWGRLKNHGGLILRDLRDLTWPDSKKRVHVAVVMGSDTENLPARPLLEGGVRKNLHSWFDMVGYLFTSYNGEIGEELRVLQIAKTQDAEAKCRLHNVKKTYGVFIERPDLAEVVRIVNDPTISKESK